MKIKLARFTSRGRITIPAELRRKYKLEPGRRVKFEVVEDGIRIIPFATTEEIKANIGFLKKDGKRLLKALMEEKSKIRL